MHQSYINESFDCDHEQEYDIHYQEYHTLVHHAFPKDVLQKVEDKTGYGKFLDSIFLDTLEEILNNN